MKIKSSYSRNFKTALPVLLFTVGLFSQASFTNPAQLSILYYDIDSPFSFLLPSAYGQVNPTLEERGRHYEIYDNQDGSFTYSTGGVPLWALNPETNQYQPTYHKTHEDGTEEFRNGYITIKAKGDIISFYDAITGNDLRVQDEDWLLLKDGNVVNSVLQNTQVIQNGNSFTYRLTYTSNDADFTLDYNIFENKLLDHNIEMDVKQNGNYQFQQKWKGVSFDKVNEKRINGKFSHDFTLPEQANSKTIENIPENIHQNFEIRNNGQLIAFEKTGKITGHDLDDNPIIESKLLNFELDKPNNETKYHWGYWNLNAGESLSFNQADTFTSNNPTEDGYITDKDGSDTCENSGAMTEDDSSDFLRVGTVSSSSAIDCYRSYVEWNVSSIPNDVTITNTVFKFAVGADIGTAPNCDFYEMSSQPSVSSMNTIFTDAGDDTVYVNNDSVCATSYQNNQSVDLGSSADTDVKTALTNGDWVAVGIKSDDESGAGTTDAQIILNSEEDSGVTPPPTLEVTYTPPSCTPNTPTSLTYGTETTSQIPLSWTAPSNCTMTGLEIERNIDGTGWINIYDSTVKTSHTDTSLTSNESYDYRVRYESDTSTLRSWGTFGATETIPGQVTGLTVTATSGTTIDLSWDNITGDDENGYKIERRVCAGSWSTIVTDTGDQTTTYIDSGLTGEICYGYKVSAISDGGTGTASTEDTETSVIIIETDAIEGTTPLNDLNAWFLDKGGVYFGMGIFGLAFVLIASMATPKTVPLFTVILMIFAGLLHATSILILPVWFWGMAIILTIPLVFKRKN